MTGSAKEASGNVNILSGTAQSGGAGALRLIAGASSASLPVVAPGSVLIRSSGVGGVERAASITLESDAAKLQAGSANASSLTLLLDAPTAGEAVQEAVAELLKLVEDSTE